MESVLEVQIKTELVDALCRTKWGSKARIARRLGISEASVGRKIRGERGTSLHEAQEIAAELGVRLRDVAAVSMPEKCPHCHQPIVAPAA